MTAQDRRRAEQGPGISRRPPNLAPVALMPAHRQLAGRSADGQFVDVQAAQPGTRSGLPWPMPTVGPV